MIDQRIDERLRRVSKAVVTMTPEPPGFPERAARPAPSRLVTPAVVGFALALVLGFATVLVLAVRSDSDPLAGEQAASPLPSVALGDGFVWPSEPLHGTAESVAMAFAVEALEWEDAAVTLDEGAPEDPAPTWLTIESVDVGASVRMMVSPTGIGAGWALYQIGIPPGIRAIEPGHPGARIPLDPPDRAVRAVVTIRVADGATHEAVVDLAALDPLAVDFVDVDPQSVYSELVRYVDVDGAAIGAAGGWSASSADPMVISEDPFIVARRDHHAAAPPGAPEGPESPTLHDGSRVSR